MLPERLRAARRATDPAPAGELSERERTVLRLLSGGMSEREIAAELFVAFNTVHSHVKSLYRKLGVSSRARGARARAARRAAPLGELARQVMTAHPGLREPAAR